MARVIGVDPGPIESAWCILDGDKIEQFGKHPNDFVRTVLIAESCPVCIEMIASYGMPVGREVFETCVWIGRFLEVIGERELKLTYRKTIAGWLCNDARAKDANVRQALLDLYGPPGTKKQPGPTYGLSKDDWSALAVATWGRDVWLGGGTNG